jgi:hypothetical protein
MTPKEIAQLIPAEYRKEILELNIIENAQAISSNESMLYLVAIWKNYVEPDFSGDCNLCLGRVLTNLKNMLPTFVELEKESNLLKTA